MDTEEHDFIRWLVKRVEECDLRELYISSLPFKVIITKSVPTGKTIEQKVSSPMIVEAIREKEKKKIDKKRREMKYGDITSPGVGFFYLTDPRVPNAKPYVKKGTKIKRGQVVGLIKHLGFYDEIVAHYDGRIREIYVSNAVPVDYKKPLFKIRVKH